MKLSHNFDESKLFSAFRFFDGLPLVEEDLHQLQDKERFKTEKLLSGFYHQGVFGDVLVKILSPNVLKLPKTLINLSGELYVIAGDGGADIDITVSPLPANIFERTDSICIEGFFEEINTNTKVNDYGGLDNAESDPGLIHPDLGIQVSTRYQFKWRLRLLEGISDLAGVVPLMKDGTPLTGKTYQSVPGEKSLLKITDPAIDTEGNTQYLIRLFRVSQKDYKNLDDTDIILEETAKYHRAGHGWMGMKKITLGEMQEDQVRLFEMRGMPLEIYKVKTL